jgi:hypothetical protein
MKDCDQRIGKHFRLANVLTQTGAIVGGVLVLLCDLAPLREMLLFRRTPHAKMQGRKENPQIKTPPKVFPM